MLKTFALVSFLAKPHVDSQVQQFLPLAAASGQIEQSHIIDGNNMEMCEHMELICFSVPMIDTLFDNACVNTCRKC